MTRDTPPDPDRDQTGPFPDARSIHEAIRADPDEYPAGWAEQVRFRERYDLPPFRPPRFTDGRRVQARVDAIEAEHGIRVSFVRDGASNEEWTVEIGGRNAFRAPRYRDDASNTVVEMTAKAFENGVEQYLKRHDRCERSPRDR